MKSGKERKPYGYKLAMALTCGVLTSIAGYYAGVCIAISEGYREEGLFGAAVGAALGVFLIGPFVASTGFVIGGWWGYTRGLDTLNNIWKTSTDWLMSVSSQVKGSLPSVPATGSTWNKLTSVVASATNWIFSKKSLPENVLQTSVAASAAAASSQTFGAADQSSIPHQRVTKSPPKAAAAYDYDIDPETGASRAGQERVRAQDSKNRGVVTNKPSQQSTHKQLLDTLFEGDPAASRASINSRNTPPGGLDLPSPKREPAKVSEVSILSANGGKTKQPAKTEAHSWTDTIKSVFSKRK